MLTDRKKFFHHYPGGGFKPTEWKVKVETKSAYRPNNPASLNNFLGITRFGAPATTVGASKTKHISTFTTKKGQPSNNITENTYKELLRKHVLPKGTAIFETREIRSKIFQQNNDPCHGNAREAIAEWNASKASSIQLLQNWPPNSHDLSPAANVLGVRTAKSGRNCTQCL
jgi:hypothetical protein